MAEKGNARLVGAFVVSGLAIAVLLIAFFGGKQLFERKLRFVCYFPGNVNGLTVGAAVKFRGVPIGSVFDMRIAYRQKMEEQRLPVFIELEMKRMQELGVEAEVLQGLSRLIVDRGLRARLDTESLITGQLYVNLDFLPGTELHVTEAERHGEYPEIPTLPSKTEELGRDLGDILAMVAKADLPGTMGSIRATLDSVDRVVTGPDLGRVLASVPPALTSVRRAADRVGEQVNPIGSSMKGAMDTIQGAAAALNGALDDTRALINPSGAAALRVDSTLRSMDRAARSMQELAQFLQRNPNALVVGKKP